MSTRTLLYEYGLDGTIGCYVTDYVMTAVCGIMVVLIVTRYRDKMQQFSLFKFNSDNAKYDVCIAVLIFKGIGYLFGGICHQYYPHTHEFPGTPLGYYITWIPTIIFNQLAWFFITILIGPITCNKQQLRPTRKTWIIFTVIVAILNVILLCIGLYTLTATNMGYYILLVTLYFLIQSLVIMVQQKCDCSKIKPQWLYVLFCVISIAGSLAHGYFSRKYGCTHNELGYYSDDPNDDNYCPFSIDFNHNAWLHVIQIIAVILLCIGVILEGLDNKQQKRNKEFVGIDQTEQYEDDTTDYNEDDLLL